MTNESFIKVDNKLVLVNGHPITINDIDSGSSSNLQETKTVTITSNGTISVTPDAPYDALKKVDVTVNVAEEVALPIMFTNSTKNVATAVIQDKKYTLNARQTIEGLQDQS